MIHMGLTVTEQTVLAAYWEGNLAPEYVHCFWCNKKMEDEKSVTIRDMCFCLDCYKKGEHRRINFYFKDSLNELLKENKT